MLDLSDLVAISNGDNRFVQDMLRLFISSTDAGILSIKQASEARNWDQVAEQAHKISSPCRHVGALRLYELLKSIEKRVRAGEQDEPVHSLILQAAQEAEHVLSQAKAQLR